ncbi:hypothetical protein [Tissierella creatinophila]|uniref:Uncharacterized protein n=1 Tax=Tissierella creatinophila DSM 6911 TaxID=1123403 RepID=A0A1U7M6N0_TISCR|nr:hypothetical protein [Tissierella creatinophila]OLS02910.1 hypothetical protein TICRE_10640 [Tissierella creatinophila DSM 6911]
MFFKIPAMIILVFATIRQLNICARKQSTKEDDKFIYIFFVAITFTLVNLGVI